MGDFAREIKVWLEKNRKYKYSQDTKVSGDKLKVLFDRRPW